MERTASAPWGDGRGAAVSLGGQAVFAGRKSSSILAVYVSANGGTTWSQRHSIASGRAMFCLLVAGSRLMLLGGTAAAATDPLVSDDGGATWTVFPGAPQWSARHSAAALAVRLSAGVFQAYLVGGDSGSDAFSAAYGASEPAPVVPPVASATIGSSCMTSAGIYVDATGSTDGRSRALSFSWSASAQGHSGAVTWDPELSRGATSPRPRFTVTTLGSYRFTVTVSNEAGATHTASVTATISQAPGAPASVTASAVTAGMAQLNWAFASTGAAPTTFRLYLSVSSGTFSQLQDAPFSATTGSRTLGRLVFDTQYTFRVEARSLGCGAAHTDVTFTTQPPSLPRAPLGPVVSTFTSPRSLQLSWGGAVENMDSGGVNIIAYELRYAQGATVASTTSCAIDPLCLAVPAAQTTLRLDNLLRFTTYAVEVRVKTEVVCFGLSPPSPLALLTTSRPVAPGPPTALQLEQATGGCLTFSWEPPLDNGGEPVTSYRVELRDSGTATFTVAQDLGDAGSHINATVCALLASTEYDVRVRATSFGYAGDNHLQLQPNGWAALPTVALLSSAGGVTLELWLNLPGTPRSAAALLSLAAAAGANQVTIKLDDSGRLVWAVRKAGTLQFITAPFPVATDTWIHIAATVTSSGVAYLYGDGLQLASGAVHTPAAASRDHNFIGKDHTHAPTITMLVDEVRVWDVPRSVSDIRDAMVTPLAPLHNPQLLLSLLLDSPALGLTSLTNAAVSTNSPKGLGRLSPIATFATLSLSPPGVPLSIVATPTADSIALSWAAPLDSGGSAPTSLTYWVDVSPASAPGTCSNLWWRAAETSALSAAITRLTAAGQWWLLANTEYCYRLTPLSPATSLLGAMSATGFATTAATPVAPSPPPPPALENSTASTIQVLVTQPPRCGGAPIIAYQLSCWDGSGNPSGVVSLVASHPNWLWAKFSVTSLIHLTSYTFKASARNSQGLSDASAAANATTKQSDAVWKANNPVIVCSSPRSLTLHWSMPHKGLPGGEAAGRLRFIARGNGVEYTGSGTELRLSGLVPGAAYPVYLAYHELGKPVETERTRVVVLPSDPAASRCHADAAHASAEYGASEHGVWSLTPTASSWGGMVLHFSLFELECDHDNVAVQYADASGDVLWSGGCPRKPFSLHASRPNVALTLRLQSDSSVHYAGIRFNYTLCEAVNCTALAAPYPVGCARGCSQQGSCEDAPTGGKVCICNTGYTGGDCSSPVLCTAASAATSSLCSPHALASTALVSPEGVAPPMATGAMGRPFAAAEGGTVNKALRTMSHALATGQPSLLLMPGTYSGSGNCRLSVTSPLTVTGFKGSAVTLLDCSAAIASVFTVELGATLTLTGITIVGGTAPAGAVVNLAGSGTALLLSSSIISSGTAVRNGSDFSTGNGGCVFGAAGSNVTLSASTITNCNAVDGGGLYLAGGSLYLQPHSTVKGCTASGDGGGLYGRSLSVSISKQSAVTANTAARGGAAFLVTSSGMRLQPGAAIANNSAAMGGGVAMIGPGSVQGPSTVGPSTPTSGAAILSGNSAQQDGGNMWLGGATLLVRNLALTRGEAARGAGVFMESFASASLSAVLLQFCHFISNQASSFGGGLAVSSPLLLELQHCVFSGNKGKIGGGAYFDSPRALELSAVSFKTNYASARGGALHAESCTLSLRDVSANSNTAALAGGGFSLSQVTLRLNNSRIFSNRAPLGGGATLTCSHIIGDGGSSVNSNTADVKGGGLALEAPAVSRLSGSTTTITGIVLRGNWAIAGAAMFVTGGVKVDVKHCSIIANTARLPLSASTPGLLPQGGGVFLTQHSQLAVSHSTLTGNRALGGNGAALCCVHSTLAVRNSSLREGFAQQGGAVFVSHCTLAIADAALVHNSAGDGLGGAVCALDSRHITLTNVALRHNSAGSGGGVAAIRCLLTLGPFAITHNRATLGGGGIHADSSSVQANSTSPPPLLPRWLEVTVANSPGMAAVAQNSAELGGGVHAVGSNLVLRGLQLWGNIAARSGGGLYTSSSGARAHSISDCALFNNTAAANGGGALLVAGLFSVRDVEVRGNKAGRGGGFSVDLDGVLHCRICTVCGNSAKSQGGGLRVDKAVVTLEGCSVRENTVSHGYGGGLHVTQAKATFIDTSVMFNTASEQGGGLYTEQGTTLYLNASSVLNNNATYEGGGLAMVNARLHCFFCSMHYNNAQMGGGLFSTSSSVANTWHASVSYNSASDAGGGMFFGRNSRAALIHSSLIHNSAQTTGGALAAVSALNIALHHCTVSHNSAAGGSGGGMAVTRGGALQVNDSSIMDNTAPLGSGGGLFVVEVAAVLFSVTVRRNKALNGGGFGCDANAVVSLFASAVEQNTAGATGGGFTLAGTSWLSVDGSSINNNAVGGEGERVGGGGRGGGGCVEKEAEVKLWNCTFSRNTALLGAGGALYTANPARTLLALLTIADNAAGEGTLFWQASYTRNSQPTPLRCEKCTFAGNQGRDLSTNPVEVVMPWMPRTLQNGEALVLPPAIAAMHPGETHLFVRAQDYYGAISKGYLMSCAIAHQRLSHSHNNAMAITGGAAVSSVSGIARFSKLELLGKPGTTYTLAVSCGGDFQLNWTVVVSACLPGFQPNRVQKCIPCENGTFSTFGTHCVPCPPGGHCSAVNDVGRVVGVARPAAMAGFWRKDPNSDRFVECEVAAACLGWPNNVSKESCSDEYRGNLCSKCALGFGKRGNKLCFVCPDTKRNKLSLVAACVGGAVTMSLMVHGALRSSDKSAESSETNKCTTRILMTYFHTVALSANFDLHWPSSLQFFFGFFSIFYAEVEQLVPIECELAEDPEFPKFMQSYAMYLLLPVAIVAFAAFTWRGVHVYGEHDFVGQNARSTVAPVSLETAATTVSPAASASNEVGGEAGKGTDDATPTAMATATTTAGIPTSGGGEGGRNSGDGSGIVTKSGAAAAPKTAASLQHDVTIEMFTIDGVCHSTATKDCAVTRTTAEVKERMSADGVLLFLVSLPHRQGTSSERKRRKKRGKPAPRLVTLLNGRRVVCLARRGVRGVAGACARRQRPIHVSDINQDAFFHGNQSYYTLVASEACSAVPVMEEGVVKAVLEVYRRDPFSDTEKTKLETVMVALIQSRLTKLQVAMDTFVPTGVVQTLETVARNPTLVSYIKKQETEAAAVDPSARHLDLVHNSNRLLSGTKKTDHAPDQSPESVHNNHVLCGTKEDYTPDQSPESVHNNHVLSGTKEEYTPDQSPESVHSNRGLSGTKTEDHTPYQSFITTCIVLLYMVYPQLVKRTFALVACRPLDSDALFLELDLDFQCYNPVHIGFITALVLPALLLYVLGLPGATFLLLRRDKKSLTSLDMRFKYGFLFLGFKDNFYYWELTIILRKAAFIFIAMYLKQFGTDIQTYTSILVLSTALFAHAIARPYRDRGLHLMELHSLATSLATMQLGLFFSSPRLGPTVHTLLSLLIFALNFAFLAHAGCRILAQRYATLVKFFARVKRIAERLVS